MFIVIDLFNLTKYKIHRLFIQTFTVGLLVICCNSKRSPSPHSKFLPYFINVAYYYRGSYDTYLEAHSN